MTKEVTASMMEIDLFPVNPWLLIAPFVSAFATVIVIICSFISKSFREPLGKMIIWINFMDFLYCITRISVVVMPPYSQRYCELLEGIGIFGTNSSILWGAFFGHALYMFVKTSKIEILSKMIKYYSIIGLILPALLMMVVVLWFPYINYQDSKCMSNRESEKVSPMFIALRLSPILILLSFSLYFFVKASSYLRAIQKQETDSSFPILLIYPAICVLCWMPFIVVCLLNSIFNIPISNDLVKILRALVQLQGFFDAIVYGGGPQNIFKQFGKIICRTRSKTSVDEDIWATINKEKAASELLKGHDRTYTAIDETYIRSNRTSFATIHTENSISK